MLTGKLPYSEIDDIDTLKSIMCTLNQVILPKEVNRLPKGFKKALGAMLQVDPELRPTIDQILILIKEESRPLSSSPLSEMFRSHQDEEEERIIPKLHRRLSLPPPSPSPPTIDENTRITLALLMVNSISMTHCI